MKSAIEIKKQQSQEDDKDQMQTFKVQKSQIKRFDNSPKPRMNQSIDNEDSLRRKT